MSIGTNVKQIRELKNLTQEYVAQELGVSQSSFARMESGSVVPKVDKLQRIAEILEVDISTLLQTINVFHLISNAAANQSGYINNQNVTVDVELIRNLIREELGKMTK